MVEYYKRYQIVYKTPKTPFVFVEDAWPACNDSGQIIWTTCNDDTRIIPNEFVVNYILKE